MKIGDPLKGLYRATTPNGVRYINLHYSADPDKDQEWAARERAKLANEREWLIEMEMAELNLDGLPVHPAFDRKIHAPRAYADRRFPIVPGGIVICGHDNGSASLNPASVVLQVTPAPYQIQLLGELIAAPGTSFAAYWPAFISWFMSSFPGVPLTTTPHGSDESARARNGVTGESNEELALRYGTSLTLVSNRWADRRGAVDRMLTDMITDRIPRFVMSEGAAPVCYEALSGGYRLRQITDGAHPLYGEPKKDRFSHPMDALQYAALLAWTWIAERGAGIERTSKGNAQTVSAFEEDKDDENEDDVFRVSGLPGLRQRSPRERRRRR